MINTLFTEQNLMLFVVAVVFTAVGYVWGLRRQLKAVITATIDSLISDGYLKTHGTGKNMEILKWREWNRDKAD